MPLVAGVWQTFVRVNMTALSGGSAPTADAYLTIRGVGF